MTYKIHEIDTIEVRLKSGSIESFSSFEQAQDAIPSLIYDYENKQRDDIRVIYCILKNGKKYKCFHEWHINIYIGE